jgi:hypothetical protein
MNLSQKLRLLNNLGVLYEVDGVGTVAIIGSSGNSLNALVVRTPAQILADEWRDLTFVTERDPETGAPITTVTRSANQALPLPLNQCEEANDGNDWYSVFHPAMETVLDEIGNIAKNKQTVITALQGNTAGLQAFAAIINSLGI